MLSFRQFSRLTVAALSLATFTQHIAAQSVDITYCSTLNTASTGANSSIYQSEGLCYNFCDSTYAFAVLSGNQCWCSDYVPGSGTTATDDCNEGCVGFPTDWCGDSSKGLFAYIALSKSPSGTKGASTSSTAAPTTAAATTAPTTTAPTTTVEPTTTSEPQVTVTVIPTAAPTTVLSTVVSTMSPTTATLPPSSSASSSSSSAPTTSTAAADTTAAPPTTTSSSSMTSLTWTPTPVVSIETVGGGGVRTVTVTPTNQPQSTSSHDTSAASSSGGGLGTGGAVGLTIGLVALVGLIGAIAYCCVRRRRKAAAVAAAAAYDDNTPRGSSAGGMPQRTMSENSRYMLGTDGNRVVEAWQEDDPAGSRRSRLMPVDPRLDPFAPVYQRGDASKSRESVATIQDNHDYSRRMVGNGKGPLRAVNPDN